MPCPQPNAHTLSSEQKKTKKTLKHIWYATTTTTTTKKHASINNLVMNLPATSKTYYQYCMSKKIKNNC